MTPTPTAQLALAEEWARSLGNQTNRIEGTDPEGNLVAAVAIQHGPAGLVAADRGGVLVLLAGMEFAGELRSQLGRLPSRIQEKMLYTIKQALMECPRVAWQMQPTTVTKVGDLATLQLTTVMQLDRDSKDTFNRFADAIQELATLIVKVNVVMGQVLAGATTGASDDTHAGLYR